MTKPHIYSIRRIVGKLPFGAHESAIRATSPDTLERLGNAFAVHGQWPHQKTDATTLVVYMRSRETGMGWRGDIHRRAALRQAIRAMFTLQGGPTADNGVTAILGILAADSSF